MDDHEQLPESLLPYDAWTEDALRRVVVRALQYVAAEGLPGEHHFYLTFRTDQPGVVIPPRLRAQYPQEMTIVLQHQFWDLRVDDAAQGFSVGLSFGGVPTTLTVPFRAVTGFADPHVRYGLRFRGPEGVSEPQEEEAPDTGTPDTGTAPPAETKPEPAAGEPPQVVSLDAFRRRTPPKEE